MHCNLLPQATEFEPGKNDTMEKKLFRNSKKDKNGHMDDNRER